MGDAVKGEQQGFPATKTDEGYDPLPPPYPLLLLVTELLPPAVYLLLDWYWLSLDSASLLR